MDEVKRILLITPDFGYGGAERSVASISALLAARHEVHVVVFNEDIPRHYTYAGTLHSLKVPAGRSVVQKIVNFFRRVNRLKKLKKEIQPHVSLSFLEGADYINVWSRTNDRIILNIRGSKKYDPNIRGLTGWVRKRILIPLFYNRAHGITVVSPGLKNELIRDFYISTRMPFYVVPNYCEPDKIQAEANEGVPEPFMQLTRNFPVLITSGRIAYEKGYDAFAMVFKRLLHQLPDAKWVIIGNGAFETQLKKKFTELSLQYIDRISDTCREQVYFMGYQSNPYKWIKHASLFVLPSRTEGFPNALLEAMACGTAVVAADCPYGPADILGDAVQHAHCREHGVLLPVIDDERTIAVWTDELVKLLQDREWRKKYGSKALEGAKKFSKETAAQKWAEAISNA